MKKPTRPSSWPRRIRKLLGPDCHLKLYRLENLIKVPQSLILDWLMGRKKPTAKLARQIAAIEREGGIEPEPTPGHGHSMFGGGYKPWYGRAEKPRDLHAPGLPTRGPLEYERYLSLVYECARSCYIRSDYRDYEEEPRRGIDEATSGDRKKAFRLSLARLNKAVRRFGDEIRGFPITTVAEREGLGPEELRILAHLIKEDVAVFEGRGGAPGRLLVQIARGPEGDRLAARKYLAAEGRLRKSGLVERESRGDSSFIFGRAEGPSILDASYTLTKKGRRELLGPLLERSVSEDKADGMSRVINPRFGLDAVVLSARHREQVDAFRVGLRHRKLLYETWGLADVVHYGRGFPLLFEGPPGTGKTMLAEALAREEGLPFMSANLAQLKSMWVGESEKLTQKLFREARDAGALLFLDEADGLIGSRELARQSWEVRHVNVFLKEVEDFEGVCVLATNNVAVLDRAMESRLSLRLAFGMPDADMRLAIWKKHLPPRMPLAPDVDLVRLARRFEISGRDIKQAVLAAARAALARGIDSAVVTMADLERAAAERLVGVKSIGFSV